MHVRRRQCIEQAYAPPYGSSAISFNVAMPGDQAAPPSEIAVALERSGYLTWLPRVDLNLPLPLPLALLFLQKYELVRTIRNPDNNIAWGLLLA